MLRRAILCTSTLVALAGCGTAQPDDRADAGPTVWVADEAVRATLGSIALSSDGPPPTVEPQLSVSLDGYSRLLGRSHLTDRKYVETTLGAARSVIGVQRPGEAASAERAIKIAVAESDEGPRPKNSVLKPEDLPTVTGRAYVLVALDTEFHMVEAIEVRKALPNLSTLGTLKALPR